MATIKKAAATKWVTGISGLLIELSGLPGQTLQAPKPTMVGEHLTWKFKTIYGELEMSLESFWKDHAQCLSLFGIFTQPEYYSAAHADAAIGHRVNPNSGKFNFHFIVTTPGEVKHKISIVKTQLATIIH